MACGKKFLLAVRFVKQFQRTPCEKIVAAWGAGGKFQARADTVARLFAGRELWCLGTTQDGHPRHPLYVPGEQPFERWPPPKTDPLNR